MGLKTRDSHKLQVKTKHTSTFRVTTNDIARMSAQIKARYGDAEIEQVGIRVSRASANRWVLGGKGYWGQNPRNQLSLVILVIKTSGGIETLVLGERANGYVGFVTRSRQMWYNRINKGGE